MVCKVKTSYVFRAMPYIGKDDLQSTSPSVQEADVKKNDQSSFLIQLKPKMMLILQTKYFVLTAVMLHLSDGWLLT